MKLLITGATGFIGTHLIKRLAEEGHSLQAVVQANTNSETLEKYKVAQYVSDNDVQHLIAFMQKEKFDGVIHLASLFLAQHKPEDIRGLIDSNVFFSTSVLEAAVQSQVPWFINTGTFWQHYENADYSPVNLYAATKQAFEDIAKYYLGISPINFVTLKLSDTFGPGDTRPKIFNLWMKIAKSGETLDMSPGEQQLDISYIDNVVDGFMRLVELLSQKEGATLRGRYFALLSGHTASLKELSKTFEKVTGTTLNINWGKKEYRPREVMRTWNKGERIPGWQPRISLEEGIRRTFNEK